MKKWICLVVILSMVCYISACGKKEQGNGNMDGTMSEETGQQYDGIFPEHEPYGTGIGAMPGRVVWAHNPDSVSWDGSGYWWETEYFDETLILQMVNESIASLGGKDNAKDGWFMMCPACFRIIW